jgi:hypothetical protein
MANGNGLPPARALTLSLLLSVLVPFLTIIGGVWAAANWAATQETKLLQLNSRMVDAEIANRSNHVQDSRLGQIEYRLNWLDEEKNRDRNERKQIDRDIREALDKLNSIVIRLENNDPYRRRR